MQIDEIILNNVKVLKQYQVAKKIKNKYLESSSMRSNISRGDLPRINTIVDLCRSFNLDPSSFCTKKLVFRLEFEGEEV
jgi:hypothetical protein